MSDLDAVAARIFDQRRTQMLCEFDAVEGGRG
jgi:hypothetical protein